MRSQLFLFIVAICVIGLFSITSIGQVGPDKTKKNNSTTNKKTVTNVENWMVVVTDSVAGNTKRISPDQISKWKVVLTKYPPDKPISNQSESMPKAGKYEQGLNSKILRQKSNVEFESVSKRSFLPTASRILVNPAVRRVAPAKISKKNKALNDPEL
ncbi:MAG: hypothetical protein HKN25_12965 [Pyrinomonadaceae bacterium]|nr:hypothetical protein [Pyrinomonadaceae bacterium]